MGEAFRKPPAGASAELVGPLRCQRPHPFISIILPSATAQTKFPNLRKLTMARIMGPRRLTRGALQPIFNIDEAPQLREVQLELRPSMLVALPWQQLTSLEIHCDVAAVRTILLSASRLQHLKHHDRPSRLVIPLSHPDLSVPTLLSLNLPQSPLLLCGLSLPALTHLSIPLALEKKYPGSVAQLIARSNCNLVYLSIRIQENLETDLRALLTSVHGLLEIELQFFRGARSLAHMQLLRAPYILPELRALTIRHRNDACSAFYPTVHFELGGLRLRSDFAEEKAVEKEVREVVKVRASQLERFSLRKTQP
ncbi:hypothetical protein C8J57DRAFT_1221393 [Mycena rebaudengoi]|nr:hypothetical protein C8J57DRAFT_1221393 [Mycena rebaudengoi]